MSANFDNVTVKILNFVDMNQQLIAQLSSLGLSEKEAKLYLTLLEVGPNPVSAVARKANITRTTAYAALESLKSRGLVSIIESKGIQQFSPVGPRKLEEFAKKEAEKADKNYQSIKLIVPDLKKLTGDLVLAPKVKYYEGIEGIKTIYQDSIDALRGLPPARRIKYSYSSAPEVGSELRDFLNDYIETREKLGIKVKGIFPANTRTEEYKAKVHLNFTDVRLLPKDIHFKVESEISIYEDKVAVMSMKEDRMHGLIIESPEIASTQRAIFELAWRSCESSALK